MKLQVKGKDVPVTGIVIQDNLDQLYTTIELVCPLYISESEVTLVSDKNLKCKILRSIYENGSYHYTAVSEGTWNAINALCSSFTGVADVDKLLSSIGVKNFVRVKSDKTNWVIPQTKLRVVLRYLNKYASIQSGGAPRFYVDIDGNLSCIDLKKIYNSSKYVNVTGSVIKDYASTDWILMYPGDLEVLTYSKDGIDRFKVVEGTGAGSIKINDTTGFSKDLIVQRAKNEYNVNFYSSRRIELSEVFAETYELGTLVKLNSVDEKFIIYSRSIVVPVTDEAPHIILSLCAPCQRL